MTDQPQDRYIEVDGLRLHYVEWGDAQARTVVLLHGLQDCARSWDFFAAAMSPEYRVLALDHRGHGDSDWAGAGRYRLLDYVADIEGLVGSSDSGGYCSSALGGRKKRLDVCRQPSRGGGGPGRG